jgi:LSU ribosomal protein L22P
MRLVKFLPQKAAKIVSQVLESAVAKAVDNSALDIDALKKLRAFVDEPPPF